MARTPSKAGEVVLFMTHFIDDVVLREYRKLVADLKGSRRVVLVYNREDDHQNTAFDADICLFTFTEKDLRDLGYPRKGRKLDAKDVELFVLNYYRHYPSYRFYWAIEYDVRFTGSWAVLMDAFRDDSADLLGTTLYRADFNPFWENWRTLHAPRGKIPDQFLIRGFFPCYRLSAPALKVLDQAYRTGWSGHFEATVPTILALSGLVVEDIGGRGEFVRPGNENRFYRNTPKNNDLGPGSFVFRPVFNQPGSQPDFLWHPVKQGQAQSGWATGRRQIALRLASKFLRRIIPK